MRKVLTPQKGSAKVTLKHRVSINVLRPNGEREPVLKSGRMNLFGRCLRQITGDKVGVLVIMPGESVDGVEIREVQTGGEAGG